MCLAAVCQAESGTEQGLSGTFLPLRQCLNGHGELREMADLQRDRDSSTAVLDQINTVQQCSPDSPTSPSQLYK